MNYQPAHPIRDHLDRASVLHPRSIGEFRVHGQFNPRTRSSALPGWLRALLIVSALAGLILAGYAYDPGLFAFLDPK